MQHGEHLPHGRAGGHGNASPGPGRHAPRSNEPFLSLESARRGVDTLARSRSRCSLQAYTSSFDFFLLNLSGVSEDPSNTARPLFNSVEVGPSDTSAAPSKIRIRLVSALKW